MDGDSNGDNISIAIDAKSDYRMNLGQMITFHTNGSKNEDVGILSPQTLSSVITVAPDGSISSGGFPVGTYVSVAQPNGTNLGEQVVISLQHVNNGMVDVCDDLKQDYGNAVTTSLTSPSSQKVNGTAQFWNNGLQTQYINIQGVNGTSQIMGIPTMEASSPVVTGNCAQSYNAIAHHPASNVTPHTTYTIQALPQTPATPQYILAGGQLLQSVQGPQIYIPQQGAVAPQQHQQILTFPMNHNPNGQLVQLIMPNGQLVTATTGGNFHPMSSSHATTTCTSSLPSQTLVSNNFQGLCQTQVVPQILTNSVGQILAVSPQIIGQPSGLVQVYGGNGQIQIDKQSVIQEASSQLPLNLTKNIISSTTGPSNPTPNQPLIQIATVTDTSQVTSQSSQRSPEIPNQAIHVAQTSSPSVTSTESSTPISQTSANTVDGINLEEIKEFAKAFKIRRLSLGLTQTQVGQALSITEGPAYSQSAICRFEKLDITPKSAQKIKPVLERWMKEAEERYKNGAQNLTEFIGTEPSKKRKRRTSFTPQALEILNQHFGRSTHPSGAEMTELADSLQYDREVVRVWFCNKRQTLKNTVKKLKTVSLTLVG